MGRKRGDMVIKLMKETKVSTAKRWRKGLDNDLGNEMPTL
jgi:hypothetical protein